MSQDTRLLTELERQKKYTDKLGDDFQYPLFNSHRALESQRRSGYRNTAAAAREIVDNGIEAGATKVHVVLERPHQGDRKQYQRKDAVTSVAFIDNGSGMFAKMARFALSWGGGTHFDEPEFIGKFGFGLPNASINQTRRVEVYTRTSGSEPFMKAWLDINDYAGEGSSQSVPPPVQSDLPPFVKGYLERNKVSLEHGTVVVWVEPDRLSYNSGGSLKEHLLDDFGATYRYLLKNFELVVEGVRVQMVDPLFLEPTGRYYRKPEEGGAILAYDEGPWSVRYYRDPETGEKRFGKIESSKQLDDPNLIAAGALHVRVARFPLGFAVGKEGKENVPPIDEFAKARFEIRKSRRGMAFLRAGREIETVDVFPRRPSDVASGLGDWPLLQSYAYHWGIEVRFQPALDEVFRITNDKQTVRPIEDFWRLLASEGLDALLRREQAKHGEERTKAKQERLRAALKPEGGQPSPAELAAQAADVSIGELPAVPESEKKEANLYLERKIQELAASSRKSVEEARQAYVAQQRIQRYRVDYVDDANGPFYTPRWEGTQVVVLINKRHPFFELVYATLLEIQGGKVAKEAVDVLLIALAREELKTTNPETLEFYRAQRVERWSAFLASALRSLAQQFPPEEAEAEGDAAA
ncbi:MAG TPA: ATP-binding protein [Gemmatimonadales bacterium]|jgi:hypothetical protein